MDLSADLRIDLPEDALALLSILDAAGFEAWAVGGFVRDALLGRACSDIDIACSAMWADTKRVCERAGLRTHETGVAHGTITVICGDSAFEVTTFRSDGQYKDGRHPDSVSFVSSIEEDLARRDFTINAMAWRPDRGLVDPFGGKADIELGVIRAVGNPHQRFAEDALRILRACRFSAELGYAVEPCTYQGMLENKGLLSKISAERVTHELQKLVLGPHAGDALLACVDALSAVLPELVAMKGFDQQTPYHIFDVLEHTARVVDGVPPYPLVRWAALFHDMGKPACFFKDENGTGHFYGHAGVSVPIARGIMQRLTFSNTFIDRVLALVRRHDDVVPANPKAVKRMLARLGGDTELFAALCDLKRGDARGQSPKFSGPRIALADDLQRTLEEIIAADEAFTVKSLAINGRDVMRLGVAQGPEIGEALAQLLDAVIDGEVANFAPDLEEYALRNVIGKSFSKKLPKSVDGIGKGA